MTARGLQRLRAQRLRAHRLHAPAASVQKAATHMLAVQSQDFIAGRWALGVRTSGEPTLARVDAAFDSGFLVRAWTMRGTLHIIPARDLGWVLSVTAARQRQQAATRRRELGIDEEVTERAWTSLAGGLADGGCTRAEAFEHFEGVGIDPKGQRGIHLLSELTITGRLCLGPFATGARGTREQRFVAVDAWIGESAVVDDPLAELFVRYIDGHAPATVRDFAWWAGLALGVAREARERAGERVREVADGYFAAHRLPRRTVPETEVFALPAFDEYYLGYDDRTVACDPADLARVGPGSNGMVRATIVRNGQVVGTWTHATARRGTPPDLFAGGESDAEKVALARFARFVAG